jgi:pimeloyl-ACP methyl ester carboxylesterase
MKPYLIVIALSILAMSTAYADEKYYRGDGTEIRYYLDNAGAEDLLVIFQGSDCNSVRKVESVNKIWQEFAPDSALLTIEKYGIDDSLSYSAGERDDCPIKYLKRDTMAQRISDGIHVIEGLKHPYRKITIAGGSEGGSIALGVAAQISDLHAVLALNSGSSSFQHDVEFSIQQTVPSEQLHDVLNGFRQFVTQIKDNDKPFPVEVSGHGYAFWRDALARDLLQPLKEIDAPVLLVQSTGDKSVDPEKTQHEIKNIIARGASNVTLLMVPKLDHGFRDEDGTSKLKEVIGSAADILKP